MGGPPNNLGNNWFTSVEELQLRWFWYDTALVAVAVEESQTLEASGIEIIMDVLEQI